MALPMRHGEAVSRFATHVRTQWPAEQPHRFRDVRTGWINEYARTELAYSAIAVLIVSDKADVKLCEEAEVTQFGPNSVAAADGFAPCIRPIVFSSNPGTSPIAA